MTMLETRSNEEVSSDTVSKLVVSDTAVSEIERKL
jgi:hypothetical protein